MQLDSIRVVDFTRLLPGPYATQLLADMGADVIKVEDTDGGDYARYMPPTTDADVGAIFDGVNRGKRSISVDCTTDDGQEVVHRLAADADVFIEGFRPGVTDRLNVDYETIAEQNPEIVYVSLTGYGQSGPLAARAGHDLNYCGRAGLLSMTRTDSSSTPQLPGFPVADMSGGLFAAMAALGGLCSRAFGEDTGGTYVDIAMTDVVLSMGQAVYTSVFSGDDPEAGTTPLTGAHPWYDVYATSDDEYVTLAALEPKFWRTFCETVDRPDLLQYHLGSDPATTEALKDELTELFAERTRAEWMDRFAGTDAMVDPVFDPAEAIAQDRVQRRIITDERGSPRVGFPAVTDLPETDERVPVRGADTVSVLSELGYDRESIDRLAENGVVESDG
ncbi:CaiB/BaiF CoA transferase family protein [Halocatena halophila]|uniref:CaiB/BaiF CoA transferase family protein n=1 Tax=Halocatena halophila TaxID=2814576 RepID=UPI002ED67074